MRYVGFFYYTSVHHLFGHAAHFSVRKSTTGAPANAVCTPHGAEVNPSLTCRSHRLSARASRGTRRSLGLTPRHQACARCTIRGRRDDDCGHRWCYRSSWTCWERRWRHRWRRLIIERPEQRQRHVQASRKTTLQHCVGRPRRRDADRLLKSEAVAQHSAHRGLVCPKPVLVKRTRQCFGSPLEHAAYGLVDAAEKLPHAQVAIGAETAHACLLVRKDQLCLVQRYSLSRLHTTPARWAETRPTHPSTLMPFSHACLPTAADPAFA